MKMTVKEAVESHVALQQFGANRFPMQVSLNIAKNLRVLGEVAEEFNKQRNDLVKKFGKKNADTGVESVLPENQDKFTKAVEVIVDQEVDLALKTVSLADLGKKTEIEPNTLVNLEWMITMEGQKPTPIGRRKPH